jgi:DNA-binding response OmpR family regulator
MLFVDDDLNNHRSMKHVASDHYLLVSAFGDRAGLELVASQRPDVVILDASPPDLEGITVLRPLVSRPATPPVVMLSVRSETQLIRDALLSGAVDYVKPYEVKELVGT